MSGGRDGGGGHLLLRRGDGLRTRAGRKNQKLSLARARLAGGAGRAPPATKRRRRRVARAARWAGWWTEHRSSMREDGSATRLAPTRGPPRGRRASRPATRATGASSQGGGARTMRWGSLAFVFPHFTLPTAIAQPRNADDIHCIAQFLMASDQRLRHTPFERAVFAIYC